MKTLHAGEKINLTQFHVTFDFIPGDRGERNEIG